jgi:hypothetical protein
MVDNVNSTRGFYDVWIPIAPAPVLGLAAIRPRSLGLTAVGFAAPLYAIGVQLDMNVRDGITFAVLACGATVLVAAVGAIVLWRVGARTAVSFGKLALGLLGAAGYVALIVWLNPVDG